MRTDDSLYDIWTYLFVERYSTNRVDSTTSVFLYALVLLQEWSVFQTSFSERRTGWGGKEIVASICSILYLGTIGLLREMAL